MRNTNKKGFTIVELVIVVAVIAILAAVLIPTFSGIITKARYTADQKAVREMNNAIAMESAITLEDAIAALEKHGINAEHLIPVSAGHSFIWNETDKKIELVEGKVDESVEEAKKNIAVAVNTTDAFVEAVNNGLKYIKLEADITITVSNPVQFNSKNVTLNLNGHTLNADKGDSDKSPTVHVNKNASLTIENGTLNVRSIQNNGGTLTIKSDVVVNAIDATGGGCIRNKTDGNVIIEGGIFNVLSTGNVTAVDNAGGNITINGGTFNSASKTLYVVNNVSGNTTINGGSFVGVKGAVRAEGGNVTINGGEFKHTSDADGHTVYVMNGNVTVNKGTFSSNKNVFCVDKIGDDEKTAYSGSLTLKAGVVYNETTVAADATYKCVDGDKNLK